MAMTLFHSTTSPYVRKVDVLLRESGLLDQVTFIPGSGTPLAPNDETITANPLGNSPRDLRAQCCMPAISNSFTRGFSGSD